MVDSWEFEVPVRPQTLDNGWDVGVWRIQLGGRRVEAVRGVE